MIPLKDCVHLKEVYLPLKIQFINIPKSIKVNINNSVFRLWYENWMWAHKKRQHNRCGYNGGVSVKGSSGQSPIESGATRAPRPHTRNRTRHGNDLWQINNYPDNYILEGSKPDGQALKRRPVTRSRLYFVVMPVLRGRDAGTYSAHGCWRPQSNWAANIVIVLPHKSLW